MTRFFLCLTLLCGACTQRNPAYCDKDEQCADDERCELAPSQGELSHVCVPKAGGAIDAPLALDGRADGATPPPVDGAVADAAPDAAIRCGGDAGSCPASAPICAATGICVKCAVGGNDCPNPAPICVAGGSCAACGGDDQCRGRDPTTPVCATGGSCVECRAATDCKVADEPVCGSDGACRRCQADGECGELCDTTTGRCVAATDILFLTETGTGDCSAASPCKSIALALGKVTASRRFIKLAAGTYRESVSITQTVEIVGAGAPMSTIDPSGAPNIPAVSVSGGGAATLRRLRLANATGDSSASGASCSGGRLTLRDVIVEDNAAVGVVANPCTLTVERSRISGNDGGGVRIVASDFSLVNDIIALNGNTFGTVGGVRIVDNPPSGLAGARFEFNTVAGNTTESATAGVACAGLTITPVFANSIVSNNSSAAAVEGCSWRYSDIIPSIGTADNNISMAPLFAAPGSGNFHLMNNSPAINAADPAAQVADDIDGDRRPQGARHDMGADEVPQP